MEPGDNLQPQEHDVGGPDAVFSEVDHGEIERPAPPADGVELSEGPPELAELDEPCTPLSDTFVALTRIACRMLDEDAPLRPSEEAELLDATAALEKRYAPQLQSMGDAALWARFSITVGVVVQPRLSSHLKRRRADAEAKAAAASAARISRQGGVGEDLRPSVETEAAPGPTF